jgi:WD40 repeat protein
VVYSPDGSRIVSGSGDNTIKIWDAGSGRELDTFKGHTGGVESVAYSPDGSRIVSGSDDKTIKIWDAETGWRILWTGGGHELQSLEGHTSWVRSVVYSPDGSRIVSGSSDDTIKIWGAD